MDPLLPTKRSPLGTLVLLLLVTALMTAFELMTQYGATVVVPPENFFARLGFPAVASAWTWAGTAVAIAGFAIWLHVLRTVPLSLAYNITTATFVTIPVGAHLLLGEPISLRQWGGYALVIAGVLFLVPGLVKVESDVAPDAAVPVPAEAGAK